MKQITVENFDNVELEASSDSIDAGDDDEEVFTPSPPIKQPYVPFKKQASTVNRRTESLLESSLLA